MADKKDIEEIVAWFSFAPNSPLLGATVTVVAAIMEDFYRTLKDIELSTLQAAAMQYKREEKFFPTPSGLLEKALDLQMIAMGIPTAAEAWAMVLDAKPVSKIRKCDKAIELMQAGKFYEYSNHLDTCDYCVWKTDGKEVFEYGHALVADTVASIGGREAVFTDNLTADRARFSDAYREILARHKKINSMTPEVRAYVEDKTTTYLQGGNQIKMLTDKMEKK